MKEDVRLEDARPQDAEALLTVHRAAVRGTAAAFYAPETIEAWAPLPLGAEDVDELARRIERGEEDAIVARDKDGLIVGFGSIVPGGCELRAVYVEPGHGRAGIGGAILCALEARARRRGIGELGMDASIGAVDFYRRHGFAEEGRGEHILRGGHAMACVRMRKRLDI